MQSYRTQIDPHKLTVNYATRATFAFRPAGVDRPHTFPSCMSIPVDRDRLDLPLAYFLKDRPLLSWGLLGVVLAAIGGLAFLWKLGQFGLVDETEPLFAEAARQMVVTGDWITPYFNGETRFDKPPLIYWLMAIAYRIVGVNEWGARLPSALSAIGLMAISLPVVRRYGISTLGPGQESAGDRHIQRWLAAALAIALMGLTPLMVAWGRTGVSDMLLTGCIGSGMFCFFAAYAAEASAAKTRWYLAFYTCIGLGILAKGPVALVLPGLGIGLFLLYTNRFWPVLREARLLWGLLLMGAIAVPWFVLVTLANGSAYIDSFFGYHNFERFTSVVNRHSAPWYFYFAIVLLGFLPFSIHLPLAIARLRPWRIQQWRQQPRSAHLAPFALCWFVAIFGFFSIAVTKLPSYVLPLMPAAAVLVALMWSEFLTEALAGSKGRSPLGAQVTGWLNVVFFGLLATACGLLPRLLGPDSAAPDLPAAIVRAQLPLMGVLVWAIAAVLAVLLLLTGRDRWLGAVNVVAAIAFIALAVSVVLPLLDNQRQQPIRELALLAVEEQRPSEPTLSIGFAKPSITFYMRQTVYYTDSRQRLGETLTEIQTNGQPTALVLGAIGEFAELGLKPNDRRDRLGKIGAYQLVRVDVADILGSLAK
ncbi:glycosyltransferase family 39 protein [Synechococcus sp. PCC 7336]|uniref:ArnT family glycosyltransferase n=1 Tax=Synechococcus sp. PCC 7336 TaxID=195250 RepID=UPI000346155F|nr:glycosyltransferase family 39 protein [Synechococcus sp. PCC 7336]